MRPRAISIEGDADPATRMLIRQVLQAAPGKVDLFIQAERPASRPAPVRLVTDTDAPEPLPVPMRAIDPEVAGALAARIVAAAAFEAGVTTALILGDGRAERLARVRHAVALVAREELGLSMPQIARALGKRDHTTIFYSLRRAQALRVSDPAFRLLCGRLRAVAVETA